MVTPRRVEAGVEECGEIARQPRIGAHGLLDIGLAERRADLEHVSAIGAQGDDLARAQSGRKHQPVEAVVLHAAGPDAEKQVLEMLPHGVNVDAISDRGLEAEIVQPVEMSVAAIDPARILAQHLEAHVLQHGQSIGEQDGMVAADQLEP